MLYYQYFSDVIEGVEDYYEFAAHINQKPAEAFMEGFWYPEITTPEIETKPTKVRPRHNKPHNNRMCGMRKKTSPPIISGAKMISDFTDKNKERRRIEKTIIQDITTWRLRELENAENESLHLYELMNTESVVMSDEEYAVHWLVIHPFTPKKYDGVKPYSPMDDYPARIDAIKSFIAKRHKYIMAFEKKHRISNLINRLVVDGIIPDTMLKDRRLRTLI